MIVYIYNAPLHTCILAQLHSMHLAVPELVFTFFWQACIGFVFFVGSFALSGAEQKFACSRAFTKIYPGVLQNRAFPGVSRKLPLLTRDSFEFLHNG
jgi:hypothetical protein